MTTIKIPATPLSESNGNMGHHVETPRTRSHSDGNMGAHAESDAIGATSTVNGVTFVVLPGANQPK